MGVEQGPRASDRREGPTKAPGTAPSLAGQDGTFEHAAGDILMEGVRREVERSDLYPAAVEEVEGRESTNVASTEDMALLMSLGIDTQITGGKGLLVQMPGGLGDRHTGTRHEELSLSPRDRLSLTLRQDPLTGLRQLVLQVTYETGRSEEYTAPVLRDPSDALVALGSAFHQVPEAGQKLALGKVHLDAKDERTVQIRTETGEMSVTFQEPENPGDPVGFQVALPADHPLGPVLGIPEGRSFDKTLTFPQLEGMVRWLQTDGGKTGNSFDIHS